MKKIIFLFAMITGVNLSAASFIGEPMSNMPRVRIAQFRPEHVQAAYNIIVDAVVELSLLPGTREDAEQWIAETGEFEDLYNADDVYFNNGGTLYVIFNGDVVVGLGGIKRLDDEACELKRMFFAKRVRGKGLGKKMARGLIDWAKKFGYKKMRLEVYKPTKQIAAVALYKKLGFYQIERFRDTAGELFMEKEL